MISSEWVAAVLICGIALLFAVGVEVYFRKLIRKEKEMSNKGHHQGHGHHRCEEEVVVEERIIVCPTYGCYGTYCSGLEIDVIERIDFSWDCK